VQEAVRSGVIAGSRYASYRKLLAGDADEPQHDERPLR